MPSRKKVFSGDRRILSRRSVRLVELLELNAPDTLIVNEICMIVLSGSSVFGNRLKKELKQKEMENHRAEQGLCTGCGKKPAPGELCCTRCIKRNEKALFKVISKPVTMHPP